MEPRDRSARRAARWISRAQYPSGYLPKFTSGLKRIGIYPEITGYAISTLVGIHRKYGSPDSLRRAHRAAEAVVGSMQPNGAIPSVVAADGSRENRVYLFDQAILARGLLDLALHLRDTGAPEADRVGDHALRATDFIVDAVGREGPCNQFRMDGSPLDRLSYAIFAKCTLPLHTASRLAGDGRFSRLAGELVHSTLTGYQDGDGAFTVAPGSELNRTHYHCYALEGLVEHHRSTGDPRSWEALQRGAAVLLRRQRADGGFPNRIHAEEDDLLEDVPVAAQAVNLWRYLARRDSSTDYGPAIDRALASIAGRQHRSVLPLLDGGFPFLVPAQRRISCSWACLFFLDADLARDEAARP